METLIGVQSSSFICNKNDEWAIVLSKSEKKKFYVEAVKGSRHLTSANRVPLRNLRKPSQHRSVFDRIQWPHDQGFNHKFEADVDKELLLQ
jgi:hypothetical protein